MVWKAGPLSATKSKPLAVALPVPSGVRVTGSERLSLTGAGSKPTLPKDPKTVTLKLDGYPVILWGERE